jgi:3',5'-cyclic AMP phosphodiesterase CpdA
MSTQKTKTTQKTTTAAPGTTRRRFLADAALGTAAMTMLPSAAFAQGAKAAGGAGRGFRFVFMPCIHLRRELRSPEGLAAALQAVGKLSPKPDFILTGGDMCQNMRDQTLAQSDEITSLFRTVYDANCKLPAHYCLGNHDLAAWNKADSFTDPRYGKSMTLEKFAMKQRYYSFEHGGWRFAVLDYMLSREPGKFTAEIDAEQLAWLRSDLAAHSGQPTLVVTHAPVISAVELFSDRARRSDEALAVPFGRVISNAPALVETARAGNVRAFVSGHLHLVERLELMGHTFICSGSVSGHQWTGPRMGTPEGFGIFDCRADGSFDFTYQAYGWKAEK